LAVGILLVALVGAGVAWGLSRLRGGPAPGRVVYASERGVFVRELATGEQRQEADLPDDTLDAWPDPSGRWLAYLRRRGDLWMLDLDSGARWQLSERASDGTGWAPDRRFVAAEVADDRDLVAVDPAGRGTDLLMSGFPGSRIVWIADERFLSATSTQMVTIDLTGDRPSLEALLDDAWPLAISPDGRQLLYVVDPEGRAPRVVIAELADEGQRLGPKRTVFQGIAYRAAVGPQGFVAFSGRDRSNEGGTWVLRGRSRSPRRVTRGQAETIAFSRDGGSLLYIVNGTLYARDLRDDRTIRLSPRGNYVKAFAVVP